MKASRPHFLNICLQGINNVSEPKLIHSANPNEFILKNRKQIKTRKTPQMNHRDNQRVFDINDEGFPLYKRCAKSSMEDYKSSLQKMNVINSKKKLALQKINRIQSHRNIKQVKMQINEDKPQRINVYQEINNSFLCKSIESPIGKSVNRARQFKTNTFLSYNFQRHDNLAFKIQNKKEKLEKSQTQLNKGFITKLKKKCVQSNPHLLAAIIKRKHQTLNKQQLYHFIQKIIAKTTSK